MSGQSTALLYDTMRSLDTSTLSGSYLPIGTPLTYSGRIVKIINASNVSITISTNGSTDMDIVPSGSFTLYDAGTNRGNSSPCMFFPKGTQFSAKGSVGTGSVYLVCLYGYETLTYPPQ